jgi:hypothetical protein
MRILPHEVVVRRRAAVAEVNVGAVVAAAAIVATVDDAAVEVGLDAAAKAAVATDKSVAVAGECQRWRCTC